MIKITAYTILLFSIASTLAILGLVWIALAIGEIFAIAVAGGVILASALYVIVSSLRDNS